VLQDLFILSNGVLQLALLDKLFRGAENLLFVETKTKRHRVRTPAFFPPNARDFRERRTGPNLAGRFPGETPQTAQPGSRSKVIVRPKGRYVLAVRFHGYRTITLCVVVTERLPTVYVRFPHSSKKPVLVRSHELDERLIARIFVRGRPQDHFREHRRQVNPFGCQLVNQLPSVPRVRCSGDDPIRSQPAQAICQDVRRDPLVALHKLLVRSEPSEHHVADDQQRPAIAQHLHRSVQWTLRPALGVAFLQHSSIIYFSLAFNK
jgi:hypothetical protein